MNNIIFKALVGSHAYGTNIEGSDKDYKGVYIQSPQDVLEHGYREQISINKDETYYELKRFLELCCTGNPTMLELLYIPEDCIIYKHPIYTLLETDRKKFLSKSCKYSFGGYAYSQIDKAQGLNKKMNWETSEMIRKTPLDFCYVILPAGSTSLKEWLSYQRDFNARRQELYGVSKINNARDLYFIYPDFKGTLNYRGIINLEESSNELRMSTIPVQQTSFGVIMSYNKDGYMEHCKKYKEYEDWLKNRNTQRYVDIEGHGQKIDGKNLLHCYRLLETGIEIAEQETINVRRPNADFLIEIRKGKHNLEKLLEEANAKVQELNTAFDSCTLPDHADRSFFMSLLPKMRKEFYNSTEEKLELKV